MSFPRYPEYKDSGVEWLGEVPAHWDILPIKRDLEFLTSGSRGWASHYSDDGAAFIRIGNLTRDHIHLDLTDLQRVNVPEGSEGERTKVKTGDVLFSITAYLGSVAVVTDDIETAYVSQHVALARLFKKRLLPSWVAYVTLSDAGKNYLSSQGYGGTKIQLSLEDVAELLVTAPPLCEQASITAFLDHETARIDALVEEQKRLIVLLKEKREALVKTAITSPNSTEHRLENITNIISRPVKLNEGVFYRPIGLYNRDRGIFQKDDRLLEDMGESSFYWVSEGDLVISGQFAWEGAVALAGEEDDGCVVSHRYPVLRGKECLLLTEYLYALLATSHGTFLLNESSRGAAGRNRPLNISSLLKEKVAIPPVSEQAVVADMILSERKIRAGCAKAIKLANEHRSALISAAVTGKIDVRGWQPLAGSSSPTETTQTETV